jgi:hypothetical protein
MIRSIYCNIFFHSDGRFSCNKAHRIVEPSCQPSMHILCKIYLMVQLHHLINLPTSHQTFNIGHLHIDNDLLYVSAEFEVQIWSDLEETKMANQPHHQTLKVIPTPLPLSNKSWNPPRSPEVWLPCMVISSRCNSDASGSCKQRGWPGSGTSSVMALERAWCSAPSLQDLIIPGCEVAAELSQNTVFNNLFSLL